MTEKLILDEISRNGHTDCAYCVHAWIKHSTRWEPEDSGCDLEHEMTQDEADLAEVGKCPYFSVIEEAEE